ncbi:hypothetical protein [Chryseobacterium nepalense]|uniref:hypothetical protein n=1 Tax=Chryseobacterium nepalense TaxID=1854498 RepID=UPI002E077C58|nr:hypothetical protein [Chryseobacterium nepalense]
MKNCNLKNLIFIMLIIFLGCKKNVPAYVESDYLYQNQKNSKQKNLKNIADTLRIDISSDYKLQIKENRLSKEIDFFQPIKDKLLNGEIYAQVLYETNNIVINLEIDENANIYEDIYLSKKEPVMIEKIIRTTIIKTNNFPKKIICEQKINQPLLSSIYKSIEEKHKNCNVLKID